MAKSKGKRGEILNDLTDWGEKMCISVKKYQKDREWHGNTV